MKENDLNTNKDQINKILEMISEKNLVDDLGINVNNFTNFGIRQDESVALLDYSYTYSSSLKQ
jgi:hypothetical protein